MDTADRMLQDIALAGLMHAEIYRTGARVAEIRINPALINLRSCFNKASKDGDARIPSYLSAAIVNVMALITEPPAPKADWEREQSGRYDQSPRGTRTGPGS